MSKFADDVSRERRRKLGANLKARRAEVGMTQERVALEASLDRSFYVDVENGHHSLSLDRLFAIADALGVRVAVLVEGIE